MEDKILQDIIKEYNNKKIKQRNVCKIFSKIEELEQNEIVREYIKLKNDLNSVDYEKIMNITYEEMAVSSFYRYISSIKETNGIYLCLGTFMLTDIYDIEHGPSDYRLNRNDPRAEYRIYKDIEKNKNIQLPICECDEFEKRNTIIYPETSLTDKLYYEIQKDFVMTAIKRGQKKACKKILSKKY